MNNAEENVLSGCYHDEVAYTTGYRLGDGTIELDDKLFTTFDTGIDGGVMGEINRLSACFDPSTDLPRFAVSLKPVECVDNAGFNACETHDKTVCEHCDEEIDYDCECEFCDTCDEWVGPGEPCISCDEYDDKPGCMGDDEDDYDDWCSNCEEYPEYCECGCDDEEAEKQCDETQVSSLNAFHRARYLKTKE